MSKSWSEVIENIDLSTKPLREPRKLSCDEITDLKEKCNPKYDLTILDLICTIESLQQENEQLQEFANAKAEGRLVVLPCKVGDVVWKIKSAFSYFTKPMEDRVERIIIYKNEILVCCTSGTKFSIGSVGKAVFLSREAAEKALEVGKP